MNIRAVRSVEETIRVQVVDPECATCGGCGATDTGRVCGPCSVPVRLMERVGVGHGRQVPGHRGCRALVPRDGCATCHGTGRAGPWPCLPCAAVVT